MSDAPSLTPPDVAAVLARYAPDGCLNSPATMAARRELAEAFAARFADKAGPRFNRPAFMRAACPR